MIMLNIGSGKPFIDHHRFTAQHRHRQQGRDVNFWGSAKEDKNKGGALTCASLICTMPSMPSTSTLTTDIKKITSIIDHRHRARHTDHSLFGGRGTRTFFENSKILKIFRLIRHRHPSSVRSNRHTRPVLSKLDSNARAKNRKLASDVTARNWM